MKRKRAKDEFAVFVVAAAIILVGAIVYGLIALAQPHRDYHPERISNNQVTHVNVNVKCDNGIPTVWGNG